MLRLDSTGEGFVLESAGHCAPVRTSFTLGALFTNADPEDFATPAFSCDQALPSSPTGTLRVAAADAPLRNRADSKWIVPEPELTLVINSAGRIFGFAAGNDMSSRDIEGENPLYLPQANRKHTHDPL